MWRATWRALGWSCYDTSVCSADSAQPGKSSIAAAFRFSVEWWDCELLGGIATMETIGDLPYSGTQVWEEPLGQRNPHRSMNLPRWQVVLVAWRTLTAATSERDEPVTDRD